MPKTELIFTDEEIDRVAERIAYKLRPTNELLSYGTIARFKNCTLYYDIDKKSNDMFVLRDENGDVIGRFVEENKGYKNVIIGLLESAAEEIENCYGRETELSAKLRYIVNQHSQ